MRALTTIAAELAADRRLDGALLTAFLSDHDEAAFAELLRRHGPLVWSACCRALPNRADAEDAFQAAFLVLVRRARKLARSAEVGPWLHRVAVLTARNVSRKNARRAAKQRELSACTEPAAPVPPAPPAEDLDSALLALPDRVREAVVLCHLQGFSRREAAERLGCAEGTLSAWLSRGLAKLRRKLIEPAVPVLSVPAALLTSTAKAATATSLAPAVSSLVEGVLHMFWVKKATAAVYSAVALFALGVGVGLGTHTDRNGATAQEKAKEPAKAPTTDDRIRELEAIIKSTEAALKVSQAALDAAERRFARAVIENRSKEAIANARSALDRFKQYHENNARTIESARKDLEALKAAAKQPEAKVTAATLKRIADLEKELASAQAAQNLYAQLLLAAQAHEKEMRDKHKLDSGEVRAATDDTDLARRNFGDNGQKIERLRDELAKLRVNSNGYIEVTVRGTAGKFEYEIYEVPPYDPNLFGTVPKFGPVRTSDTTALANLLKRTKADITAPLDVRVIVEPQVTMGTGPQGVLEACAKAGYDTVTFTGYVFGGGIAQQLNADEKGEVRGYTKYTAKPVKPAALLMEIEEG